MSKKKIAEIVGAIVFTTVILATLGWLFYDVQRSQKSSSASNAGSSLGLSKIPLNELKSAEFGSIVTIKNLRKFGEIPVIVSGSERSKSNPFLVDDLNNTATPTYVTDKFSVSYPSDWSKIVNPTKNIEFKSPLEEGTSYASVVTNYQDLPIPTQSHNDIETAIKLYATLKLGLTDKDMEKYSQEVTNKTNSSYGGRTTYSYKLGDQTRKGWIFALSFATPSQELTNGIYKIIQENKDKSKYLTEATKQINDSVNASSASDSRDKNINNKITNLLKEKNLIEELNYLGQDITYNTPPFQGIMIFNYETDLDRFDKYSENAKSISQKITFTDTVTLPSSTSSSEDTQSNLELPPTISE